MQFEGNSEAAFVKRPPLEAREAFGRIYCEGRVWAHLYSRRCGRTL